MRQPKGTPPRTATAPNKATHPPSAWDRRVVAAASRAIHSKPRAPSSPRRRARQNATPRRGKEPAQILPRLRLESWESFLPRDDGALEFRLGGHETPRGFFLVAACSSTPFWSGARLDSENDPKADVGTRANRPS